jgi:predicted transcriptional regulator
VAASELPTLLTTLHGALCGLGGHGPVTRPTPAQIRASIQPDAIISFEDGRPYKVLRRHLTEIGMTPEAYRAKWGLPADYPLVPQAYSARRSKISKASRLGRPAVSRVRHVSG